MTERLYYDDSYLTQFDAVVVRAELRNGRHIAALNRSAFYPTSGGQPYDTGALNGVPVTDVFVDKSGEVWHEIDGRLVAGETVHGKIDWERRWDHMQQHGGEHMIAGAIYNLTGGGPGTASNVVAYYAYNGIRFEQYEGAPITSFKALAALYNETVQLVTCNPEIKSMDDLRGKNVSIGAAGSGVYFNAMDFLAAYDMTEEDINPQYLSFADSAEALKDGKIDAAFVVAGAPTTAVVDLCATKGAYLVGCDEEHIAKLKELNGAYTECVIPAGTYEGIDEDVTTVAVKAIIIANADVTDEEAYTIVSTIFENTEAIAAAHAKGLELNLEYASECGLPYAAGAAKYFAEKGITVAE